MGHYNQIVFSGFDNIVPEKIIQTAEKVLSSFPFLVYIDSENECSRSIKRFWDIRWNYDKDESDSPFGELSYFVGVHKKNYHLVIQDSSSFRIDYSRKTYEKFCSLCFKICELLPVQFAVFWEEPINSSPFIPSDLNRAIQVLNDHSEYNMTGLVIINKIQLPQQKAEQIIPPKSKFTATENGFYVYQVFGPGLGS